MSYEVNTIAHFERQAKKLAKRYKSLKSELDTLITNLENDPIQGTNLGSNVYKIRMAITSKGKGKSGGARVITYVKVIQKKVYLVSIYDKSRVDSITREQILALLKEEGLS